MRSHSLSRTTDLVASCLGRVLFDFPYYWPPALSSSVVPDESLARPISKKAEAKNLVSLGDSGQRGGRMGVREYQISGLRSY